MGSTRITKSALAITLFCTAAAGSAHACGAPLPDAQTFPSLVTAIFIAPLLIPVGAALVVGGLYLWLVR